MSSSNNQNNDSRSFKYTSNNDIVPEDVKQIVVHGSVTSIKPYAFLRCASLESIVIPNSVRSIGYGAFEDCSSLISIVIPNSVRSIGEFAFCCSSLVSIGIPDSVTIIGRYAFKGSSLVSIVIPDGVSSIGRYAFCQCTSLVSIDASQGGVSIGQGAFYRCTLLDQRQTNASNYSPDTHTWLRRCFTHMPIRQASCNATAQTITTNLLSNIIQSNYATLRSTDTIGTTALYFLCCKPNVTIYAIKALKNAHPDAATMRNVADMTPLVMLLNCKSQEYDSLYVDGSLCHWLDY